MPLGMGLNKNRHGTYEARKKVPQHLEEAVARVLGNGKPKQIWLKRTLATKDHSEAKRRVKAVQIEFDRILERAQELLAERPLRDTVSDAEIKLIADRHYAEMLHLDDEETREGTGRDEFMRTIAKQLDDAGVEYTMPIPPSEHTPDYGLSDSEFHKRTADLEWEQPIMQAALAKGDISKIGEHLDYLLNGLFGINLDRRSEAYRRVGLAVLRKHVAALEAIRRRTEGQPVETPSLPTIGSSASTAGATLTAACEGWKRQRQRAPGTLTEYERAIKLFTELHGELPLVQIRRSHARQFREALQDVPGRRSGKLLNASLPELAEWGREHPDVPKITAGTVNKQLTAVQAMANWAHDNGMIPDDVQWADPFRRMRLGKEDAVRGGAPFELADLQVIFGTPVFTRGERPKGGKGEAAFWLPLLALFTGARLNELSSLKAADVARNDIIGAQCIFIRAEKRSGKRLKTEQSERFVPLHPQLIAAGFLEYVGNQIAERGANAWLFPRVAPGTAGKAAFSKWFGRHIGTHQITDSKKVFHSFRHSFVDALRLAGVGGEINIALLGHTDPSVHDKYGAKDKAVRFRHRLAEAVASVAYTGLDLSSLSYHRTPRGLQGERRVD
jgi:integrase